MKTGILKRAAAALLAGAMMMGLAGCADDSWSAKDDAQTLKAGVYIYNLYSAYSEASYQVEDTSKDVLSQQVDGKDANQWIQERAVLHTKETLMLDAKMKEEGISLTADEIAKAEADGTASWAQYKKTMEGYGISKESFLTATSLFSAKLLKVFKSIYDKDGTSAVSDAELEQFYKDSYSDYKFMTKSLTNMGEDGSSTAMTDDEIAAVQKQFEGYADQINHDGKTMDDVASEYQAAASLESSPLKGGVTLTDNLNMTDDVKNAFQEMKAGEARAIKTGTYYYLVYKGDINAYLNDLKDEETRFSVLAAMKQEEFTKKMEDEAGAYACTVNDAAVGSYKPAMFGK